MPVWEPSYVNMCSCINDAAGVRRSYEYNLSIFNATPADCELVNCEDAKPWERQVKAHFRLNLHTYLGWKVYMLMTGCIASKPEYETA